LSVGGDPIRLEALEKQGQISGGGGAGGGWDSIYENDQSSKVLNLDTATMLFDTSTQITDADWPTLQQITSPCPTLRVVGAITKGQVKREELKRMREMGTPGIDVNGEVYVVEQNIGEAAAAEAATAAIMAGETIDTPAAAPAAVIKKKKFSKRQRVVMGVERVVSFTARNTIGRVARFLGSRLLGQMPEAAKSGSYHPVGEKKEVVAAATAVASSTSTTTMPESAIGMIEEEIAVQLKEEQTFAAAVDKEDEELFKTLYTNEEEKEKETTTAAR